MSRVPHRLGHWFAGLLLCCLASTLLAAPAAPGRAAIASAHPAATAAGEDILAAGGNAFDAAIAVAAALAVAEPQSSGLGGGGFFLLYLADEDAYRFVDAREVAPAAATEDMYLDAHGQFQRDRSLNGPLAAGIPGEPAGMAHLAARYGRLPPGSPWTGACASACVSGAAPRIAGQALARFSTRMADCRRQAR